MENKICFKCGKDKPLTEYYKHSGMQDGHLNKCKGCSKLDSKNRENKLRKDASWVNNERERGREKYYRLGYRGKYNPTPESKKRTIQRYNEKYPEKLSAKSHSRHLTPEVKGNELHHWSYNEEHWKDVIELTPEQHARLHRYIVYDQERMMYRGLDGVLLDSKKSHELLIKKIKQMDSKQTNYYAVCTCGKS